MWWGKYLGKLLGSLGGGHGVIPNTVRILAKYQNTVSKVDNIPITHS